MLFAAPTMPKLGHIDGAGHIDVLEAVPAGCHTHYVLDFTSHFPTAPSARVAGASFHFHFQPPPQ
jgi:hypothetical protein